MGFDNDSFFDLLNLLSLIIGIKNLELNDEQVNKLEQHLQVQDKHLSMQDEQLLQKIIEQNVEIIRQNEEIIELLKGDKL